MARRLKTVESVRRLKRKLRLRKRLTNKALANEFGYSERQIQRIDKGEQWGDVE